MVAGICCIAYSSKASACAAKAPAMLRTAIPSVAAAHAVPERWRPGYLFGVKAQADGPLIGAACSDGRLRLWAREGGDSALSPLCTLPWNQARGGGEGGMRMGPACVQGTGGAGQCCISSPRLLPQVMPAHRSFEVHTHRPLM